MGGLRVSKLNRGAHGDGVLLVNVDGSVYRVIDAYEPELSLGNIGAQSIEELLKSDPYGASLMRDAEEYEQHCKGCTYRPACNASFVYDTKAPFPYDGSCVTAWHCISFMVQFIREQGYGEGHIRSLLTSIRQNEQAANAAVGL
jgi:radical SAM protein with 4Fe4S-binding SPASM domain